MSFTITPSGISSPYKYTFNGVLTYDGAETFVNEPPFGSLDIGYPLYLTGIPTSIAFGSFNQVYVVDNAGAINESAFGTPLVGFGILPEGLFSDLAFGTATINPVIRPTGLPSNLVFGSANIANAILPTGIPSGLAFGSATEVFYTILPTGIIRTTTFGNFTTEHDVVDFGIPSSIAFGAPLVAFPIKPQGFNNGTVGITNIGYPTLTFNSTNLSSLIFLYDSAFYTALRAMETYCYAQTNGVTTYGSGFTSLSNAIVAWLTKDRTSLMSTYMSSLFSYIAMNMMYGTSNSLLSSAIYNRVWSMNGYNATIKAQANTYYADGTGNKLTADANSVTAVNTNGTDNTTASNLYAQFNLVVANQVSSLSLNPTPPAPNPLSKAAVANLIFVTLGYKSLYLSFNANLTLPPGV